jgi:phage shock protein E
MTAKPLYLDVRTPEEYAEAHVEPSINIPVDELAASLHALGSREREIIIYCRSGRRSAIALEILRAAGFTNVTDAGSISNVRAA